MALFQTSELLRYSRHLVLPEVGLEGQTRLKSGSVLLVGAGGLGSPLALYLAAAGVGRIGLVEFDQVDLSNLQRQVLYGTADVGRDKIEAARERLAAINPHILVEAHPVRLEAANAREIVGAYDVVADGTDNFATRYLVNDACVLLGKPNVYGSVYRFEGQVSVFDARTGPCYRCLFPEPPPAGTVPSCAEAGVLGILPGVIGLLQATEVVKILLGRGETLAGRLLLYDALGMEFRQLRVEKDPNCPACGAGATLALRDEVVVCDPVPAGESIGRQMTEPVVRIPGPSGTPATKIPIPTGNPAAPAAGFDSEQIEVTPRLVRDRLAAGERIAVVDVREPYELEIASLPGVIAIPLGELPARSRELDPDVPVVTMCHVGIRSLQAAVYLRANGLLKAWSMAGGIDAWAREVDPSVVRY